LLSLIIKIKDIHHCKETDRVLNYPIDCQNRPRATHMPWSVQATWFLQAPCWLPLV